uniref:F-actin-capping protein subunit beta n=1 Tax=Caenorhabditis japonica TaxID=281687 RepID=A0A8R1HJV4_CAEJA
MGEQQLDCALDLMRRLPPQQCDKNLSDLIDLCPHLVDDLLSTIDQPLKIAADRETGKQYLLCDYNRDGDSYRSPWSNTYDPPLEDGQLPTEKRRKMEIEANAAFESYRDLYFEGGVSSVYFWDLDNGGFAGIVLIKKEGDGAKNITGCWDSIHVIEITERARQAHYKLTSTIMLWLQTNKSASGVMNLGGSLTRQHEMDAPISDQNTHLANMGRMIEDQESKMRLTINEIYFGKTKKVMSDLRSLEKQSEIEKQDEIVREISNAVASRGAN